MRKDDFRRLFGNKPLLLDGAAGTKLLEMGMPAGVCPEYWASQNLGKVTDMHTGYVAAGSQAVYSFTFGANERKLAEYGLAQEMRDINMRLCEAACEAVGGRALIGGDISPMGDFVQPFGEIAFEEAIGAYYNQARVLAEAGADFIIIETMIDLQDARAALIGAKEACALPVCVTMSFDESGHTLTGSSPIVAATTLCALGADAIGANCGIGPDAMENVIRDLNAYSNVPIIAKPNAGLPTGEAMDVDGYAQAVARLVDAGAAAIGGCCGSSYEHIEKIAQLAKQKKVRQWGRAYNASRLSSMGKTVDIGAGDFCTIGERINPTGKKKMQAALKENDMEHIAALAMEQLNAGAQILDVNVGMPGIEEETMLPNVMLAVAARADVPLCIDSTNAQAIENTLRAYPGRALVNSVSAESGKTEKLFPIIEKYGAMYIALPIGDEGVPQTTRERINCAAGILEKADTHGIDRGCAIVDALALSVGSERQAGETALGVIDWCKEKGLNSVMGVSNISFGLPERVAVNVAMLVAAMARGMTSGIVNVCDGNLRASLEAAKALVYGKDIQSYAALYTQKQEAEGLFGAILSGDRGTIHEQVELLLANKAPEAIVEEDIIPALDEIGDLFSKKKAFLPQLMASAEAAKLAFTQLEPLMLRQSEAKAKAVIATVQGDIHDIGKNIVGLMLRNHGFEVIDLGRDVPNETILETAQKERADIVGLSALITTTMPRMGECAQLMQEKKMECALMVGGAVVTDEYAKEIGALYSRDAAEAVEVAKRVIKEKEQDA